MKVSKGAVFLLVFIPIDNQSGRYITKSDNSDLNSASGVFYPAVFLVRKEEIG